VLLQLLSDEKMRGRVMSIYAAACLGLAPLGSLMAGSLAGTITAEISIAAMAAAAMTITIVLYRWSAESGELP
jgi:hypothetical protein